MSSNIVFPFHGLNSKKRTLIFIQYKQKHFLRGEPAWPRTSQSFHRVEKLIRSWFLPRKITFVFFALAAAWRGTIMSYWLSAGQPQQWEKSLAANEKIDLPLNPEPGGGIDKHYTFYKPPTTRSIPMNIGGHNGERRWASCCMRSSSGSNHLVSLSARTLACVARV